MVYLAHDTLLDRDVAFALVKTEGLDETARTRITREAQAMGRLGSHPHIVTVFDLGQEHDQPYIVTELMAGGDVERAIAEAPDCRLPLDQAVKIAIDTCQGLEFAHSRSIVHRDLKPGNVWLSAGGIAKIGDFGLAVSPDGSRLTTEGMMVGTVSYMPPEQAMGGEVTPQSDLYSLGATLYEMVAGRPPFLGDDAVAIIGQHINTQPVAPTWHNSQCPSSLEVLILRLLAKNPSERPQSASEVLSALNAINLEDTVELPTAFPDEAHILDSLAGGVFVGRQREMGELKRALEASLSGHGQLVTLVGASGVGKTRTAEELATYAGMRGTQVVWGRCYEEQGTPPYWPWIQAIRSYVRDRDPEQLRSEMGAGAADIAEIVSDVRERLPDVQSPPELDPAQSRFRLFDSITTFLRTASQRQPLVLVLDNLHWADRPSLALLEFVVRELSGSRLLLIGTYRDEELSSQHPLSDTLSNLNRSVTGGLQRMPLGGLTQQEVARFIELVSGFTPPPGLVDAVYSQTEGNPLFVTEAVRLLVQEGELTAERASRQESWTVPIPEGVKDVIGRRLSLVSQQCNDTLTIAAVMGREFSYEQLEPLVKDVTDAPIIDLLEEALSSQLVEELPHVAGRYQFTHALTQQTLVEGLPTAQRLRLHARIAEGLEERYGANTEAHAVELAYHFAEAEPAGATGRDKLVHYCLLAGERALATYAHEDALAHFEAGLAAMAGQPLDAGKAALHFGLGRAQSVLQLDESASSLRMAFDYYMDVDDLEQVVAIAEYGDYGTGVRRAGVRELLNLALGAVPSDSHYAGRLLCRYGHVVGLQEGDYEEARDAFEQALVIARRDGDAALEMNTLSVAASVDGNHTRYESALINSLNAIHLSDQVNDPRPLLNAHYFATSALMVTGDLEQARQHATAMLEPSERLRDRFWIEGTCWKNASVARLAGDWEEVRKLCTRGMDFSIPRYPLLMELALAEHESGDALQGDSHLQRLLELTQQGADFGYGTLVAPIVARITGSFDYLGVVESLAESRIESSTALPASKERAQIGLAMIAILKDERVAAERYYRTFVDRRGTMLYWTFSADRLLGLLCQTMGQPDLAAAHFENALAFCRNAGYRPELAWTCCDYADWLLSRASPEPGRGGSPTAARRNGQAKAMTLLDESLAISSELAMRPLVERVLARKLELQGVASVDTRTSIDAVASAVQTEQPDLRSHAAPDGTVTILFSDIVGSTEMTERLGDQRMQQILRGHNAIVREQVAAHAGFEVKSLGDGFMMAFSSARRALLCAMDVQRAFAGHNQENPDEPVMVRIGLHTGEFIQEMEDFFGKNVILASRIAGQAQGGEILVSSLLKELTDSAGDIHFGEAQEVELKGLSGMNRIHQVVWE